MDGVEASTHESGQSRYRRPIRKGSETRTSMDRQSSVRQGWDEPTINMTMIFTEATKKTRQPTSWVPGFVPGSYARLVRSQ
eukprot:2246419-Pleurochrysis_carterae.AAC.6